MLKLDDLDDRTNQALLQAKASSHAAIADARTSKTEEDKESRQEHERACEVCVKVSRPWTSEIRNLRAEAQQLAKELHERRRKEKMDKESTRREEEEAKKQIMESYTSISQKYWDQKVAAITKFLVIDDVENDELENDVRSFVDKTTHLTTAVLRQGVEMLML